MYVYRAMHYASKHVLVERKHGSNNISNVGWAEEALKSKLNGLKRRAMAAGCWSDWPKRQVAGQKL